MRLDLCAHCRGPLGSSPSDDFCSDKCMQRWHAARTQPLRPGVELLPEQLMPQAIAEALAAVRHGVQQPAQPGERDAHGLTLDERQALHRATTAAADSYLTVARAALVALTPVAQQLVARVLTAARGRR